MNAPALPSTRPQVSMADPGFGVYVHIPFCLHRCHYCDFNTYEGQDELHDEYVDALVADIERSAGGVRPATSVFLGGGTPTLLAAGQLGRVLRAVEGAVGIAPDAEITVEANPETVDEEAFGALLDAGFNRFSIGVQSLAPHVLGGLGRTHSAGRAIAAIRSARAAGASDLNVDLIFGSPWESAEDWQGTLDAVLALEPDHVSAYALTVEEGTPLATLVNTGRVAGVDPDVQAERYEAAEALLGAAGYDRYEVSNWARPGHPCRHNLLYWSAGDYLGFGAGAHGHASGRRYWNVRLPRDFIASVAQGHATEAGAEVLHADARAGEAFVLGLRLTSGVDLDALRARFGDAPIEARLPIVGELTSAGLLVVDRSTVSLASDATLLANDVLCRLL